MKKSRSCADCIYRIGHVCSYLDSYEVYSTKSMRDNRYGVHCGPEGRWFSLEEKFTSQSERNPSTTNCEENLVKPTPTVPSEYDLAFWLNPSRWDGITNPNLRDQDGEAFWMKD